MSAFATGMGGIAAGCVDAKGIVKDEGGIPKNDDCGGASSTSTAATVGFALAFGFTA